MPMLRKGMPPATHLASSVAVCPVGIFVMGGGYGPSEEVAKGVLERKTLDFMAAGLYKKIGEQKHAQTKPDQRRYLPENAGGEPPNEAGRSSC